MVPVLNAADRIFSLVAILLRRIHTDMSDNSVIKLSPLPVIWVKKALHETEKVAIQNKKTMITSSFIYLTKCKH